MKKNWLKNILYPTKEKSVYETTTIDMEKDNDNPIIKSTNEQVPINQNPTIFTPITFNQVEQIANEVLTNRTVIVDISNTEPEIARRIIDFMSGVIFARDGGAEKIASKVYMFTPKK